MRLPLLILSATLCGLASAQSWRSPAAARADSLSLEVLGLDSIPTNRFIGKWSAVLTFKAGFWSQAPVTVTCWTDTTHVMWWSDHGAGRRTCRFIDLSANTSTVKIEPQIGQPAVVSSVQYALIHNAKVIDRYLGTSPPEANAGKRTVAGVPCTGQVQYVGPDTIRYCISSITPSPFRDVMNWLHVILAFEPLAAMAFASDSMPLHMVHKDMTVAVTSVHQGILPRPVFDITGYKVVDLRTDTANAVPLRRGPAPFWMPGWAREEAMNSALERHPSWSVPLPSQTARVRDADEDVEEHIDAASAEVVNVPKPPSLPPGGTAPAKVLVEDIGPPMVMIDDVPEPPAPPPVVEEPPYTGPPWFTVDVKGRTLIAQPNPPKEVKKKCEVAVEVEVNSLGGVSTNGTNEAKTFFATPEMKELAMQLARKMKFEPLADGSGRSVMGLITFRFQRGM